MSSSPFSLADRFCGVNSGPARLRSGATRLHNLTQLSPQGLFSLSVSDRWTVRPSCRNHMKEREASEDGVYFCDEIMDIKYKGPVTLHNNGSKCLTKEIHNNITAVSIKTISNMNVYSKAEICSQQASLFSNEDALGRQSPSSGMMLKSS